MKDFGIVIIGRNEGERLLRCFASIPNGVPRNTIIYVDSGSIDRSVEIAQSLGIGIVRLDMSSPCSAARARNDGFQYLVQHQPNLHFVQFIDGDCELCEGWLDTALNYFSKHNECGIVAGRTIEKYPDQSVYNRLCDLEWLTPAGIVTSCGGIFMARTDAFHKVGGFNQNMFAGEEPELCYRLRILGWEIHRLDAPMVFHDAGMTQFSQWWKRSMRSGSAYAQGYALHGRGKEKYCLTNSLRIWLWAFFVPIGILFFTAFFSPWWLCCLMAFPVQIWRIALSVNSRFNNRKLSLLYAFFNMLGKFPQLCGQLSYWTKRLLNNSSQLIEYK